jgi:uncharacterized membrane protein
MEKCPVCGKNFFSKNRFQTINHNGKDLLVCPFCFKQRKNLVIQRQISEQEKKEIKLGWMGLFIVILVIIAPLYNIVMNIINWNYVSADDLFNLVDYPKFYISSICTVVVNIMLVMYSIYAGLSLYSLKDSAVSTTKSFLIFYLVIGITFPLSQYFMFLDYGIYTPVNVGRGIFATCIFVGIWYWFITSSKTVKRIYFDNPEMVNKTEEEMQQKITEKKQQDEALNILQIRYAKGEITKEKYEQMKKDMGK